VEACEYQVVIAVVITLCRIGQGGTKERIRAGLA
jgi:hypothetical protein